MGHPLIEEFCRQAGLELRPEFFRRCQRVFRDEVQPRLEQADVLEAENAALKARIETLEKPTRRPKSTETVPA